MGKKRIYYFDILRAIACVLVILVHVSDLILSYENNNAYLTIAAVVEAISHISVPIFFMISGALFLDESRDISWDYIKKRTIKIIFLYLFWSFLYCIIHFYLVFLIAHKPLTYSPLYIVRNFLYGYGHLWFIKTLALLYLLVPIFRLWIKKVNIKYIEYLLLALIILTIAVPTITTIVSFYYPIVLEISSCFRIFNMDLIFVCMTYFILGWYLFNYDLNNKKIIYIISIISSIISVIMCYYLSIHSGFVILAPFNNDKCSIFMLSVSAFVFFKDFKYKKESKIIKTIVKYSFGIYLVHMFAMSFMKKTRFIFPFFFSNIYIEYLYIFIGTLLVSFITAFILNKIPVIKKIINL